jgi:diguanylate cyclase (GGDEF)-like protein
VRGAFRSRYVAILLTALLGTLASFGAFLLVLSWEHRVAEIDFQSRAKSYLEVINSELVGARTLLYTLGAYVETNEHAVSRGQFDRFSQVLHNRVVGLRDIDWAPLVTRAQRAAFERTILAPVGIPHNDRIVERDASGKMVTAGDRSEYYPVLYVQTETRFRKTELHKLLGFDLASERLRAAAISRAIQTWSPAATQPVRLIVGSGPAGGIVAFMPVGESRPASRRTKRPLGLVLGGFLIAPMVENIIARKMPDSGLNIYLFDQPVGSAVRRLIYWHASSSAERSEPAQRASQAAMKWRGTITLIDQPWQAILIPTSPWRWQNHLRSAGLTLAAGLIMTALIVACLLISLRRSIELEGLTASLRATTEDLHRNNAQIIHMARHDALTGLSNRLVFRERIDAAIASLGRGVPFAILYLDLDRFKDLNDTLGHGAGDRLLCAVAERIAGVLREVDTIARLGGDEFAMVIADTASAGSLAQVAERLISDVAKPLIIDEQTIVAGVSIGIAVASDGATAESLLAEADLALYEAKDAGRGTYRFFESRLRTEIETKRSLERDLRAGLERGEFEVYYQPIISLAHNHVIGFEALVRWNHPEQGLLAPDRFIALAEEIGAIAELGLWVLTTACEHAAGWPAAVKVAVNVSPRELKNADLVANVSRCLTSSGLAPNRLEIEITEAAVLHENATTLAVLEHLRALGVTVAFDDFGTGFSSLSSLLRLPFDNLKIDRSFVAGSSDEAAAIVRAIIGLACNLGLLTTGEGVETFEQLAHLQRLGCTQAQGYLFSRPQPNNEVPRLLQKFGTQQNQLALTGSVLDILDL